MPLTRRDFTRLALTTLPLARALSSPASAAPGVVRRKADATQGIPARRPNSKWAGVQVGMNVPYNFGQGNYMSGDDVLARCVELNVSAVELRSQPVEMFLGAPGQGAPAEELSRWRTSASMDRVREFRKKYEDAGVAIEIVKFDGIFGFSDAVLDYSFALAKALGARAISCELPLNQVDGARRLGQFADKHQIMIGFHGHTQMTPGIWEQAFGFAKHNGANLDIGHFVGGNKTSPVPFLKTHHDRITHIHVKDKTLQDVNVPFGQGDTPIKEVLQLIRDNKWNIQATIEFEYPVPKDSDRMKELAKCVEYCRRCLVG